MTMQHLAERERGKFREAWELAIRTLLQSMQPRGASWVAVLDVSGADDTRSTEIADTAVDIAIAALQCAVPPEDAGDAAKMSRVTGRTLPPWRGNISIAEENCQIGMERMAPGQGIAGDTLGKIIEAGRQFLDAAGYRISAYVTGRYLLPQLEQAWCDSAFWFHEALSEPLDTIAVPKLGIAMEVLFGGSSFQGSKSRMVKAIRAFFGLALNDLITPTASINVRQFVENVQTESARLRHGNWSTLMTTLYGSRRDLELFSKDMLKIYAQRLHGYSLDQNATDNPKTFLDCCGTNSQGSSAACA